MEEPNADEKEQAMGFHIDQHHNYARHFLKSL
jgi:hypothetical protein